MQRTRPPRAIPFAAPHRKARSLSENFAPPASLREVILLQALPLAKTLEAQRAARSQTWLRARTMNLLQIFVHPAYNGSRPYRINKFALLVPPKFTTGPEGELMITIGDVIRDREPYYVRDTATALDAAEYMMSRNIGAVCVLNEDGKLSGIFSERDLLRRIVLKGKTASDVPIRDVMSQIEVVIDCGGGLQSSAAGSRRGRGGEREQWRGAVSRRDRR